MLAVFSGYFPSKLIKSFYQAVFLNLVSLYSKITIEWIFSKGDSEEDEDDMDDDALSDWNLSEFQFCFLN